MQNTADWLISANKISCLKQCIPFYLRLNLAAIFAGIPFSPMLSQLCQFNAYKNDTIRNDIHDIDVCI